MKCIDSIESIGPVSILEMKQSVLFTTFRNIKILIECYLDSMVDSFTTSRDNITFHTKKDQILPDFESFFNVKIMNKIFSSDWAQTPCIFD